MRGRKGKRMEWGKVLSAATCPIEPLGPSSSEAERAWSKWPGRRLKRIGQLVKLARGLLLEDGFCADGKAGCLAVPPFYGCWWRSGLYPSG